MGGSRGDGVRGCKGFELFFACGAFTEGTRGRLQAFSNCEVLHSQLTFPSPFLDSVCECGHFFCPAFPSPFPLPLFPSLPPSPSFPCYTSSLPSSPHPTPTDPCARSSVILCVGANGGCGEPEAVLSPGRRRVSYQDEKEQVSVRAARRRPAYIHHGDASRSARRV